MHLILLMLMTAAPSETCKARSGGCVTTCDLVQDAREKLAAAKKAKAPPEELARLEKEVRRAQDNDDACRIRLFGL